MKIIAILLLASFSLPVSALDVDTYRALKKGNPARAMDYVAGLTDMFNAMAHANPGVRFNGAPTICPDGYLSERTLSALIDRQIELFAKSKFLPKPIGEYDVPTLAYTALNDIYPCQ